jgi:hypothetical protein
MHILFPSEPFNKKVADEPYAIEYEAFHRAGLKCALFSPLDFDQGAFKPWPSLPPGDMVLYRGWMLKPEEYQRLHAAISLNGNVPLTNPDQYRACHYLPEWYSLFHEYTPETVFASRDADFVSILASHVWPAYFVKDYVKSLTTKRGSIASSANEVSEIVSLIEQFRGEVEGGVCIRKYEDFLADTEERYFVLNGKAYGRSGDVPELVREIARHVLSPCLSVDVVMRADGVLRLIEVGDGQVSGLKKWSIADFVSMVEESGL